LLTNAIKYTTAGGCVKVRISHQANKAEISIIDTGIGIKPEHIQKLFRIDGNFARVGTEQERGTGLGLILCRELIEKIGGTIGVESVFGKGSRFFFEILTDTTHKPIAQPLSERMIT